VEGHGSNQKVHDQGPVGKALEVFLLADFNLNKNMFIGPRVHFPVAAQNQVVSDVPTTPSTANIQSEIYFQATL